MNTRLTLYTATLVQESAMSISGVDRESTSDRPFTMVDGIPVLSGRGLKGAAVAMARRCFEPLPRSVSEDASRRTGLRRSAWEFSNATLAPSDEFLVKLRAGVGILQKTGARASGVLYDREVVPAGTRWSLEFRVDWSWADAEGGEAEGVLGYVLAQHWAKGRCWLGGDVARGLGWCHLENIRAYRLDEEAYEAFVTSGRSILPDPLPEVPVVLPTRAWCFRTLEVRIGFGEYRPNGDTEPPWGLDMLSVGTHSVDRATQFLGSGVWARPPWASGTAAGPELATDRAILMEQDRPVLPGSSVRGSMRHEFSRAARARGKSIEDPHPGQGCVDETDDAGKIFGTVARSSRVLICDATAFDGWEAARLHMHAEDEFSAGSYGSAKRDAVRLLRASFLVRITVEGSGAAAVDPLLSDIDNLVALGALRHLAVGGHKTRGSGWGHWAAGEWQNEDVAKVRSWIPAIEENAEIVGARVQFRPHQHRRSPSGQHTDQPEATWIRVETGTIDTPDLALGQAVSEAKRVIGTNADEFVAWWCEPSIDFTVTNPPEIFGRTWPDGGALRVDEVALFLLRSSWRAARTERGIRWVFIQEVDRQGVGTESVEAFTTPARLHGDTTRFSAKLTGKNRLIVREWRSGLTPVGFTLNEGDR